MKGKRIILISLFLIMAIINIQAVMAENIEEINIENSQDYDDLMIVDDGSINNQDDNNQNVLRDSIEDGDNAIKEEMSIDDIPTENDGNLKNSNSQEDNLQSSITVDGKAYNQMTNKTIQAAIDNASSGDTIKLIDNIDVLGGAYIDKNLTIFLFLTFLSINLIGF